MYQVPGTRYLVRSRPISRRSPDIPVPYCPPKKSFSPIPPLSCSRPISPPVHRSFPVPSRQKFVSRRVLHHQKTVSRPFPYRLQIVSSRPIPSIKWVSTFPPHSHPAVSERKNFPYHPSLGKNEKKIRLMQAKCSHPVLVRTVSRVPLEILTLC